MEFIQILYNAKAGKHRKSKRFLGNLVHKLSLQKEKVNLFTSAYKGNLTEFFADFDPTDCKCIFVLGGDGTLNEVVNGMMKNGIELPVFVCPTGTANDFAYHIGVTANVDKCIEIFNSGRLHGFDVGKANDNYFINVCGAGLFTNSCMDFDPKLKDRFGKLAYYSKGITMLPLFKKYRLRIRTSSRDLQDDFYFFLVLNGVSTGGLKKIACEAKADDGYLDFVGIKAMKFGKVIPLFFKLLLGQHLRDKNIVFFKTDNVSVEAVNHDWVFKHSDLDGQTGPDLPLNISVLPKKLNFFVK